MAADPASTPKLSPVAKAKMPIGPDSSDQPMANPIFTRLSGKRKNQAGKLAGFVIVAVIIAAIGLIGLYFATGPHASRPTGPAPSSHAP